MEPEERIHGLLGVRDYRGAATTSVETYGPEILGFLVTWLRDENDASEVFSQACEDLWRGLEGFDGRSSLRTWFYALARHAASRLRRSPQRDPRRRMELSSEVSEVAAGVRSATLPHLRSEVKDRFASIRDSLAESDRALLVLRVDRDMSWNDIARVFSEEDQSQETLERVAARLRKRFQALKQEIRRRAREAGGIEASLPILAALDIRMPATRFQLIASLVYYGVLLRLRGNWFWERSPARMDASKIMRVDTCFAMAVALGFIEPVLGFLFHRRSLLRALAVGDCERISRSLGLEAAFCGMIGGSRWRRTQRLLHTSRELAQRSGSKRAEAYAVGVAGMAYYLNGRFRDAAAELANMIGLLEDGR